MKKCLFLLLCAVLPPIFGAEPRIEVAPEQAVIVVPKNAGGVARFAAGDLRHHLRLITGRDIPVVAAPVADKFCFDFTPPAGAKLKPEEARWELSGRTARFWGDDAPAKPGPESFMVQRTGTLSAVCDFLEKQLGVRWLEPGDGGVFYTPSPTLKLQIGSGRWEPGRLVTRSIRTDYAMWQFRGAKLNIKGLPEALQLSRKEYVAKNRENILWLRRQRMGESAAFSFGHAFTTWWEKYGKSNPEYFALYQGKRAPARPDKPETLKMCPSNPGFQQRIVDEWKVRPNRRMFINICENDWADYCECAECRKLDMPPAPGKKWNDDLSDRYFHFANAVLKRARLVDPQAKVCIYAYAVYKFPPRREKVDSGTVIGFVPSMIQLEETEKMYRDWRTAGADWMVLRPNDHHLNTGLPMGLEKQLFDAFKLGVRYGIVGTDYDTCHGFWPATGVADYILARAHIDPKATFDELFADYCSGYGAAAPEIAAYFTYWRKNIWEKRIYPDRKSIIERGRYGNFRRGVMWAIKNYYNAKDFAVTGAMLDRALARTKTPVERARVEWLKLGHRHATLTFAALSAHTGEKIAIANELLKFRIANRDKLNVNLMRQTTIELEFGDLTGIGRAAKFSDFSAVKPVSIRWFFAVDPDNRGEREEWEKFDWPRFRQHWAPIYTDTNWENQSRPDVPEKLRRQLKNYDGYGYYSLQISVPSEWKGREVGLFFGAVDESAKIYLDGKLVGIREFKDPDDWNTPFTVWIDRHIDWNRPQHTVVVRVHDSAGAGGVWKPVYLVRR